jgi:hypothetical protein
VNATSVSESFSAQNASFVCLVNTGKITRFSHSPTFSPGFEIHQVFTTFWISPGVHQVLDIHQVLEIHQNFLQGFTRFWKFIRFSPSFHQVFRFFDQALAINQEVSELHQFSLQ